MTYDFDQTVDRHRSHSSKWHRYAPDVLPMWVADMDFRSPEPVIRALRERVEHGIFGYEYSTAEPELSDAICAWLARQYNWQVTPEQVVSLPGVVSGLNLICHAYGHRGDGALMLTPLYPPFLSAPLHQGMTADQVELRLAVKGQQIEYEIDFDAFEKAITPRTTLFLQCHPHNPTGHEYTRAELERLGEICLRHNLIICSDEVHCDLLLDGTQHTPMAAIAPELADRCITLMAPSKTFNMPGLGFSFAVVTNPQLRQRLNNAAAGLVPHVNLLGQVAALAAYSQGEEWLLALRRYLTANRDTLMDYLAEHLPAIKSTVPQATYLAWLDCRAAGLHGTPFEFFLNHARVATNDGTMFGPGGDGFVRFNFGCPRAQMIQALEQMKVALQQATLANRPLVKAEEA